jgi:hypothetical protein
MGDIRGACFGKSVKSHGGYARGEWLLVTGSYRHSLTFLAKIFKLAPVLMVP